MDRRVYEGQPSTIYTGVDEYVVYTLECNEQFHASYQNIVTSRGEYQRILCSSLFNNTLNNFSFNLGLVADNVV